MRRVIVSCLVMLLSLAGSRQAAASEGFEDLVQVLKSGGDEQTLMQYVNSSPVAYALTVDEILYLTDLGLSADAIKAINVHGQSMGAAAPEVGTSVSAVSAPNVEDVLGQAGAENLPPSLPEVIPPPPETPPLAQDVVQDVVQETIVAPPVLAAPAPNAADYSTFYEGLAPYGNWINMDGEWCWQPTAILADPGWSPYCQRGHWVYSDCGWVWQSSYSWGWAPFHYGRWRHHSHYGWIWRPDRVWGPAWVCWRYSDAAIGWAPLPPEVTYEASAGLCYRGRPLPVDFDFGLTWEAYTFVPTEHFCEAGVARHRFPRSRMEPVFHAASIVQNRIVFQQGRVLNFGPPPDRIAVVTHQQIRPIGIVDLNVREGAIIPRPRMSGSTLAFYRPPVAPTVHENPRQIVIRHEAGEKARVDATRRDEVFHAGPNMPVVQGEQARGRESRGAAHVAAVLPASVAADTRRNEQLHLAEVTRQRQAEENVARQQEEQRQRAVKLIQDQNAARQHAQEQARQQALAEAQHKEAESARQREAQNRAQEAARQQESQRQKQEAALRQDRQRQAEAAARSAQAQSQALRTERQAEEAAARQHEEQARASQAAAAVARQHASSRPTQEDVQGYGDASVTGAAASRGAISRHSAHVGRGP